MVCRSTPNLAFWTVAADRQGHAAGLRAAGVRQEPFRGAFARATGRQRYTLIGSFAEPADIGGYPYPVQGDFPYMAVMPPKWAQDCQHGQWVLFIDELTTCPPPVQATLLGVIAEHRVGDSTYRGETVADRRRPAIRRIVPRTVPRSSHPWQTACADFALADEHGRPAAWHGQRPVIPRAESSLCCRRTGRNTSAAIPA